MTNPSPEQAARKHAAQREARRFFKFLVVGGFSFMVDTGSLSALVFFFTLHRVLAKGIAFGLAVLSNFIWNRFWTYPDSRTKSLWSQVTQFVSISLVGLVINLVVFGAVDHALSGPLGPVLSLYAAQAAAVGTAMIWNFAANRLITYGDVKLGH